MYHILNNEFNKFKHINNRITNMEVYNLKWEGVRKKYPNKWVLIEALKTRTQNNIREILDMAVISEYADSTNAWKGYKTLHLKNPSRELYIFHTSNERIQVIEETFTGVRRRRTQ